MLHTESQFIRIDDGFELVVFAALGELLLVERLDQVELLLLLADGTLGIGQVANLRLAGRNARSADRGPLVNGGQKGVAVVARAAVTGRGAERHESRKVLVVRAEAVSDPASH